MVNSVEPFDWNVVVIGAWNPAILTPAGIQKRLFDKEDGTFEVQFSVDGSAPPRVVIEQLAFVVTADRLDVRPIVQDLVSLRRAAQLAQKAASVLPETPFVAAGLNFRFRFEELPEVLLRGTGCALDQQLSSSDFVPVTTGLRRSYQHLAGRLNASLDRLDGGLGTLVLNFHSEVGSAEDVKTWLVEGFESFVGRKGDFLRTIGLSEQLEGEGE